MQTAVSFLHAELISDIQTPGTLDSKSQREVAKVTIADTEFVALDSDENEVCWSKFFALANYIIVKRLRTCAGCVYMQVFRV